MRLDFDTTNELIEVKENSLRTCDERIRKIKCQSMDDRIYRNVFFDQFRDLYILALLRYARDGDGAALKESIGEVMEGYLPLMQYEGYWEHEKLCIAIDFPMAGRIKYYDYWEYEKFFEPYLLYIVMYSREEIARVSEESSRGRFGPKRPPLKKKYEKSSELFKIWYERIVLSLLRAYFVSDSEWLARELELTNNIRINYEINSLQFRFPAKLWHPLFQSLFDKDERTFAELLQKIVKDYHKKIKKQFGPDSPFQFHYHQRINFLPLALLKIANTYQGMSVEINDFFVPKDLINWS